MKLIMNITKFFITIIIMLCLTACASPKSDFYVLNSMPVKQAKKSVRYGHPNLTVGIDKVKLAEYLKEPQIITRVTTNQVDLNEFQRWAEPLKANVNQVILNNLSYYLPRARVIAYPWPTSVEVDYKVDIEIIRFDTTISGQSILTAQWEVLNSDGAKVLYKREMTFHELANPKDYNSMVYAMNQNLTKLTHAISRSIVALARR